MLVEAPPLFKFGYLAALNDLEELLDNAVDNWGEDTECRHWDHEIRDQIIVLKEQAK